MGRHVLGGALFAAVCVSQVSWAEWRNPMDPPAVVNWEGNYNNEWSDWNWFYDDLDTVGVRDIRTGWNATFPFPVFEWGSKGGRAITIDAIEGVPSHVVYDWWDHIDSGGDWRSFHTRVRDGGSGLTITGGSTLTIEVDARLDLLGQPSADGMGTQFDSQYLNLDNGTLIRGKNTDPGNPTPGTSGGPLAFGTPQGDNSWDQGGPWASVTEINLTHGGRIENDGQMWFGYWDAEGYQTFNRTITMNINNGSVDLTGGNVNPPSSDPDNEYPDADLIFTDFEDLNHTYAINFTGPGSIVTDNGIINAYRPSGTGLARDPSSWVYQFVSYEDLWNAGLLQANGLSGLDGETFGDYFAVTGTAGMMDYTLTSELTNGLDGDYNGDGKVDAADYVLWRNIDGTQEGYNTWRSHFGQAAAIGSSANATVPDPATIVLLTIAGAGLYFRRRRAAF